ncbi:CBN-GLR-5 protein [Aphelenchoides avenae]|nr:CBN-GLR-5 protein [Aphelenchus avenae]
MCRVQIAFCCALFCLSLPAGAYYTYKFGAIFREKEDAHLAAAVQYAVKWINSRRPQMGQFEIAIRNIAPWDHYGALHEACKLFDESKVLAIFGPADNDLNAQLAKLTDMLDVPLFTVTDDYSVPQLAQPTPWQSPPSSSRIGLFPQAQLHEALSDLIKHWRWPTVIVVYSEPSRIRRLVPFLEKEAYSAIRFRFVRVQNGNYLQATKQIKTLEDCTNVNLPECSEFSRILLDMTPGDTYEFLLAALQMGLIDLHHWFLLTSMDMKTMDWRMFRHNHARFIALDTIYPEFVQQEALGFSFKDFTRSVKDNWEAKNGIGDRNFKLSEASLMFDAMYLAAYSTYNLSQVYPLRTDIYSTRCRSTTRGHIPYKYGRRLIQHVRNTSLYGLTGDLSRVGHGPAHNFSFRVSLLGYNGDIDDIGFWKPSTDVQVNMSRDSKAQLQNNVKVSDELKPHFRVTTIMERPYVMLKRNHFELDENSQFEGFCIDLLEELSKDLGFTYTIHIVKDSQYGNDIGNGSWNGMIGEILRREADMVVAPFTANFRRAEVVDFTKPFLSLGISILFKIPTDHQPDLFSFLNPLSLEIWVCIAASIVGLTLGMYVIAQITPYEWNLNFSCCTAHQPHPAAEYALTETPVQMSNNYSFWNTLWYVMSTMLKGGCDFGPRAVSTRLLGGTWWVFTLVIVSAYTANLAAVLTVSRPHIPIRSLDDLSNQESKIESHQKMWNYMKDRNVFVKSNREGVEKVLKENYAYLMESSSLEYEVQQNCNLTQIGGVLGSKGYGIALEKNSEWTDRISRQILLYQKRGIIEMKKTKWWRSKGASCHGVGSTVKHQRISLNLHNVSGLFVILFSGLVFSIVTVMIEFCVRSKELAKNDNRPLHQEILGELRVALNIKKVKEHRNRRDDARDGN